MMSSGQIEQIYFLIGQVCTQDYELYSFNSEIDDIVEDGGPNLYFPRTGNKVTISIGEFIEI
jgi:hypothetical protein